MMDLKPDSIIQWFDGLEIKIRGMDKEIQSLQEFNLVFKQAWKPQRSKLQL